MSLKRTKIPEGVIVKAHGKKNVRQNDHNTKRHLEKTAKKFAPILQLHHEEISFPMSPVRFIEISRFRKHRKRKFDQGFNRKTNKWDKTNSRAGKYYNIPISVIDSYGPCKVDGKNRRPRDKNNGKCSKVFLQPSGNISGDAKPNGSVPAYYYYRNAHIDPKGPSRVLITYWVFFGNNPTPPIAHQGDWSHVTVLVSKNKSQVDGMWFSRHGVGPIWHPKSELRFKDGRPIAYVSKKSHGTFVNPGRHKFEKVSKKISKYIAAALKKMGFADYTSDKGISWNISLNLLALKDQPWKNFAGAWGEVGEFKETTGPLGPWHKRRSK